MLLTQHFICYCCSISFVNSLLFNQLFLWFISSLFIQRFLIFIHILLYSKLESYLVFKDVCKNSSLCTLHSISRVQSGVKICSRIFAVILLTNNICFCIGKLIQCFLSSLFCVFRVIEIVNTMAKGTYRKWFSNRQS